MVMVANSSTGVDLAMAGRNKSIIQTITKLVNVEIKSMATARKSTVLTTTMKWKNASLFL
jgi:hypothetical protein